MAIPVKNQEQINKMRESCRIVAEAHRLLAEELRPGITTLALDELAHCFILSQGATPSFLGYHGFPASICVSVNEEVIHGIPGLKKLKNGDIVSIDVGALKDGFHGDAARTYCIGEVSSEAKKLVEVTEQSFFAGVALIKPGVHLHEISAAIEAVATANGFSVVRDFVGHGVGRKLHEEPQIPHYRMPNRGPKLSPGMTLAIEPMVNAMSHQVNILADEWTVVTRDGGLSAHYEHTVLITEDGYELLTVCGSEAHGQ